MHIIATAPVRGAYLSAVETVEFPQPVVPDLVDRTSDPVRDAYAYGVAEVWDLPAPDLGALYAARHLAARLADAAGAPSAAGVSAYADGYAAAFADRYGLDVTTLATVESVIAGTVAERAANPACCDVDPMCRHARSAASVVAELVYGGPNLGGERA